jgi:HNH endonuclease
LSRANIHKSHAPRCVLPDCNNLVHYINKYKRKDNSDSYQWNTLCPRHLNTIQGKNEVKTFKENRGCEAVKIGFECPGNHGQYQIDHIDGNKYNVDENNIAILCPNCHQRKTLENKDYNRRYKVQIDLPSNLWMITL